MFKVRKISILISLMLISFSLVFSQDVPQFEVVDIASIGIPEVLWDRWGCTVSDIDRNGWPDINHTKWRGTAGSQVYLNFDGIFTEISENSPQLIEAEKNGNATRTPTYIDYDNDGDRDLWLGTDYEHFLFRNENNVFVNVSEQMGVSSSVPGFVSTYSYDMSSWIDYDLDGDLDGLVFQTNNPSFIFYRNDGTTFTDIAAEVGLADVLPLGSSGDWGFYTGRTQWIDFDNDGDPDLNAGFLMFRNDNGFFTEVSELIGFLPSNDLWFTDWFDFDVDGDMDFFGQAGDRAELWMNDNGTFVDATQEVGLDLFNKPNQTAMNVGDLDNDGDEDVFVQIDDWTGDDIESLLLNDMYEGIRNFIDVAQFAGMTVQGDRKGSALIDYDMDGKLDVFIPSVQYGSIMYHNLGTETVNNWIGFDLWGTASSKDPLGTLVTLYTGDMKLVRYTKAGTTFKLQHNPYIHFGIGQATSIDSVVISWPLGTKQVLINPEINQYHKIKESSGTSVEKLKSTIPEKIALLQNYPNPFNANTKIEYSIPKSTDVKITIFDLTGREIVTLVEENQKGEQHFVFWNGRDQFGSFVSTGLYTYNLKTDQFSKSRKLIFIK
jgi:hypothetical protein